MTLWTRHLLAFLIGFTLTLAVMGTLALLSGCQSNTPSPPPAGQWTCYHCTGMTVNGDGSFTFPNSSGAVGYIYKSVSAKSGQTITLHYALSGSGTVVPSPASGYGDAQIRLFVWEKGDDMTCNGAMASYRWWSNPGGAGVLISPSDNTLSVVLDPALWTNCYGQHDPAGFNQALGNLLGVGFTFGAEFFGHGVYSNGQVSFTIKGFTVQ